MRSSYVAIAIFLGFGCSSVNAIKSDAGAGDGAIATCAAPPDLGQSDYCKTCTIAANANPATCKDSRPINACCTYVAAPRVEIARATGLHYFSSTDTAVKLDCLTTPGVLGTPKPVKMTGHVKLFSSGGDSVGVKIQVYKEGANGALGEPVGEPVITTADDPGTLVATWSAKCPSDGCKLRSFSYANVPTETPLIVKTSDATGTGNQWSDLYDYNVYLSNASVDGQGNAAYDANAVAATDVNTVASAAGGLTIKADKGVLAGEVHDCGDVRLSGASVDTDLPHDGTIVYFGENEADPLPDQQRAPAGLGTSKLGLFGALNMSTGTPIRISAVGMHGGQQILLGTYVVQAFPGAVTALSFRGRRAWQ